MHEKIFFFFKTCLSVTISIAEQSTAQGCTSCASLAVRKWRENEKIKMKWRENEEMVGRWRENEEIKRDSLSTFPHFLFTSSLSIHFLYQKSQILNKKLCRKMLNMTLLSQMSQKAYLMRYEKIILGRIRCEKAPKVVPACH